MTGPETVWAAIQAVFWLSALCLLIRWPGRVIGVGVAVVLWTAVGPGAAWTALGIAAGAAVAWHLLGYSGRLLAARPDLRLALASAVVAVVAPNWTLALAGLAVTVGLVARAGWPLRRPAARRRRTGTPAAEPATDRHTSSRPDGRAPASAAPESARAGDGVDDQAVVLIDEIEVWLGRDDDTKGAA